jgi:hypothetical protein
MARPSSNLKPLPQTKPGSLTDIFAEFGDEAAAAGSTGGRNTDPATVVNVFNRINVSNYINDPDFATYFKQLDEATQNRLIGELPAADQAKVANKLQPSKATYADKAALLGGAAALGTFIYLDKKANDENKKVQQCIGTCLPSNWDAYEYENLEKSALTYKTATNLKEEFPDEKIDSSQPFCTEKVDDCAKFCTDKCKDLHETDLLPGTNLFKRGAEDLNKLFKSLNPFAGLGDLLGDVIFGVLSVFICLVLVYVLYSASKG